MRAFCVGFLMVAFVVPAFSQAPDKTPCPMFGGTPARNMVNTVDKNIPVKWDVESKENIRWVAKVGNKSYGGPVIAGGKVFVGTNNAYPRDKSVKGFKAVLMCFAEADGKFLWQAAHDIPADLIPAEAIVQGLCSTPVIEGDRAYYVLPGCEVVCTDTANGKTLWKYDMAEKLKVVPYHLSNCSPLVVGDLVMVITGNGVDDAGKLPSPKAPSFIALNKIDGTLKWQNNMPGEKIIEGQWTNPTLAVVNGKPQVIFPGGDAAIYSLDPDTGNLLWKFNCNPKPKDDDRSGINYFVSTPVFFDNKIYIGMGQYPEHPTPTRSSYMLCIDATRTGDVSPKSLDSKDPQNKESALVWSFGGPIEPRPKAGRPVLFGRTMATAAIHDGLVYVTEESGYMHCLDAKTGQRYWDHDFKAAVWGSAYYVDGKIYVGTEDGEIIIFAAGKERKLLGQIDMGETIHSTPVVANGVLYVATKSKVYAIAGK